MLTQYNLIVFLKLKVADLQKTYISSIKYKVINNIKNLTFIKKNPECTSRFCMHKSLFSENRFYKENAKELDLFVIFSVFDI